MLSATRLRLHHGLFLYAPPPGAAAYLVRNELNRLPGLRLVWTNRLGAVREYQARHWVAQHENAMGYATTGRYMDYLRPLLASAGFGSTVDSLASAATLLLRMLEYPPGTDPATVEFLVVRDASPISFENQ
jgi:hypothetical protein